MSEQITTVSEKQSRLANFVKEVGKKTVGIAVAYGAINMVEAVLDTEIADPIEFGLATFLGSTAVNLIQSSTTSRNLPN